MIAFVVNPVRGLQFVGSPTRAAGFSADSPDGLNYERVLDLFERSKVTPKASERSEKCEFEGTVPKNARNSPILLRQGFAGQENRTGSAL